MTTTNIILIHFLSALCFSSLLLAVSAQFTNSTDVRALGLLKTTFPTLSSTGDPCLPKQYLWVQCSSDFTPRITALNLGNYGLVTVSLPDFSGMDALEIIDFSDNELKQEFPDFFASFPNLKVLNLANNFLSGTVPISLSDKSKSNALKLTLTGIGMTNLCFSDEKTCGTEIGPGAGTPRVGTPGSGTKTSLETTTARVPRSTTDDSFEKTLPIALGIGIPIFVIFWAIVLANDHQNRKAAEAAAITTAGPTNEISGLAMPVKEDMSIGTTNEISGLAMPVNDDREQQTHPTVHPLRV